MAMSSFAWHLSLKGNTTGNFIFPSLASILFLLPPAILFCLGARGPCRVQQAKWWPTKGVHVLKLGTCDYVKLQGRDGIIVADYLTLKWGNGTPYSVGRSPPANSGDVGSTPGPGRSHMPWGNWACAPQLLKPTCSGARKPPTTKAHAPRACAQKQEKPPQREACQCNKE